MMPRLGDTVLFVVRNATERAAIVVRVNEAAEGRPPSVNLMVLPESDEDAADGSTYGGRIMEYVPAHAVGGPIGWQTKF